jgi:predicted nuclease of predicted toxin-antitoxin system
MRTSPASLRARFPHLGHDISTADDEGLLSKPDAVVAAAAKRENRVLLTLDVEFANLVKYPPGSHPGIILFRPRTFGPLAVNQFIQDFLCATDVQNFAGCVVVVDTTRIRVRWPKRGQEREGQE